MNLTSFFANKCFEYLLRCDSEQESRNSCAAPLQNHPRVSTPNIYLSPPWGSDTKRFKSLCNGCGDCIPHCDNDILFLNKHGYPQVDFSKGSCNFCGACAKSCPTGALQYDDAKPAWNIQASITANCLMKNNVLCSTCTEHCDREAIILPRAIHDRQKPEILSAKCNGCGACFGACPVGAITFIDDEKQVKS